MDDDLTPSAAVRAASEARMAAAARAVPTRFPAATAALFAAGLTGIGLSELIGWDHVAGTLAVLAGVGCCIAFLLMHALHVAGWMRSGVIPLLPSRANPRNGLRDLWISAGIAAAGAAAWAATGHFGWALIVWALTGGAHHWRRLLSWPAGPASSRRIRDAGRP